MRVQLVLAIAWVYLFVIFFFQAEDGIRDLVRSRGLGDVYKRQVHGHAPDVGGGTPGELVEETVHVTERVVGDGHETVSYTHLTLPTIYSV